MAMRGVGQGLKVVMLQFLKGSWRYGELDAANKLYPDLTIRPLGEGFVQPNPEDPETPRTYDARKRLGRRARKHFLF
jgi:cob(I)alamin adenosyltransferase